MLLPSQKKIAPPVTPMHVPTHFFTPLHLSLVLVNGVKLVAEEFVHLEHVNSGLLENRLHLVIASDLAFIAGILQAMCLDVFPEFLDHLGP